MTPARVWLSMAATTLFEDLVDQYKIEQRLTEKRYTDLYQAYDVDEDRPVTLDVLRPPFSDDGALCSQFLSRAKTLAQIRHPNIARIYDMGRTPDGRPFVAQDRVEGYTLSQRFEQLSQRDTPANSIYALKLVRQVSEALLLAERLNFYHYDLNPGNIWLKSVSLPTDDTVILLDLFVPFQRQVWKRDDYPPERLAYLAPEQCQGRDIDTRSHVYSLGAMLFRLLGGADPSGPVRLQDHAARVARSGQTALERARPGLAPETYALVDRAMRADNARRYDTMEEFISTLDDALTAEELRLRPATRLEGASSSRRFGAFIPLLVLAVLLVAGLVAARNIDEPRPETIAPTRGGVGGGADVVLLAGGTATTDASLVVVLPSPSPSAEPSLTSIAETAAVVLPPAVAPTDIPPTETRAVPVSPTPAPTETPSAEPTATLVPPPQVRINLNSVNLRGGPGTDYPQIGYLIESDVVEVVARFGQGENTWYLVEGGDGRSGWLWAGVAEAVTAFDAEAIPPAATIPPTLTPTPTPTPTPTIAATPTLAPDGGGGDGGGNPEPTQAPAPTRTPPPLP